MTNYVCIKASAAFAFILLFLPVILILSQKVIKKKKTIIKQRCLHLWKSQEGEIADRRRQERSSDCLPCNIKAKAKQVTELVKV